MPGEEYRGSGGVPSLSYRKQEESAKEEEAEWTWKSGSKHEYEGEGHCKQRGVLRETHSSQLG